MSVSPLSEKYRQVLDLVRGELVYIIISLCITLIGIGLMIWLGPNWEATILTGATFLVALIIKPLTILGISYYFLCYKTKQRMKTGFALTLRRKRNYILGPALGVLAVLIPNLFAHVFPATASSMGQNTATALDSLLQNYWGILLISGAALLAPFYEEVFFRQFVYTKLKDQFNSGVAILVATTWFWAAHIPQYWGNWMAIFIILGLSIVLTLQRHYTKSLIPSIMTHLVHNGIVVCCLLLY